MHGASEAFLKKMAKAGNTDQLLQAVHDYVKTPRTDYALLITGPWGCGKTHFWKNSIVPSVQKLSPADQPTRTLYASLYGVEDTKDIDSQLFLGSYPGLRSKWITRVSGLSGNVLRKFFKKLTRFELPSIDLRWLVRTSGALLCFDDLERCKLPMEEVLGYINGFVEHDCVKTVIICDEDKLLADKERKKTYQAMKEKVVGFSFAFQPDHQQVTRALIAQYAKEVTFSAFLRQNEKLIRQLHERSGTSNIRALKRSLDALYMVFEALREEGIDPTDVGIQVIYALFPTAFELYAGRASAEKLRAIHAASKFLGFSALVFDDKDQKKSYEQGFAQRYLADAKFGESVGSEAICDLLVTGFLDRAKLLQEMGELVKQPEEKQQRLEQLSFNFREMTDEDFAKTTSELLQDVEQGRICSAASLAQLVEPLWSFADAGLLGVDRRDVLRTFENALKKAEEAGTLQPDVHLEIHLQHPVMSQSTDEVRQYRQLVVEANRRALRQKESTHIADAVAQVANDPEALIVAITSDEAPGLRHRPVLQLLDPEETVQQILAMPNALRFRFAVALQIRYLQWAIGPEFLVELPILEEINDKLKEHLVANTEGGAVPLGLYLVKGLTQQLDKPIARLRQLHQGDKDPTAAPPEPEDGTEQ